MEVLIGRKRKLSQTDPPRTPSVPLRWSNDIKEKVAKYVNIHYDKYKKVGEKGYKKMHFLREMRDKLHLKCTDMQLKNAFALMMRKYKNVRDMLSSEEPNLPKNWVLCECPYFEMLDKVLCESSNVTPPCLLNTASVRQADNGIQVAEILPSISNDTCNSETGEYDDQILHSSSSSELEFGNHSAAFRDADEINKHNLVRTMISDFGVHPKKDSPKNVMSAFERISQRNADLMKNIEQEKLKLESEKFTFSKRIEERRLQLEVEKLEAAARAQEREHEFMLEKIKAQGQIEIKKLELQIQLEILQRQSQS